MTDDRDDPDDMAPWWNAKNARRRVRHMVGRMVANEKARQDYINAGVQQKGRERLAKHFARFDPPQDHASLSHRLHIPYTGNNTVTDTEPEQEANEVDDDDGYADR